uniref:KIB1-4 beta-propeller domain-containing protein n=1 Tax=Solanum lycopersicum TaxID=4081 RepID=A0A3Q7HYN2_SOLLC
MLFSNDKIQFPPLPYNDNLKCLLSAPPNDPQCRVLFLIHETNPPEDDDDDEDENSDNDDDKNDDIDTNDADNENSVITDNEDSDDDDTNEDYPNDDDTDANDDDTDNENPDDDDDIDSNDDDIDNVNLNNDDADSNDDDTDNENPNDDDTDSNDDDIDNENLDDVANIENLNDDIVANNDNPDDNNDENAPSPALYLCKPGYDQEFHKQDLKSIIGDNRFSVWTPPYDYFSEYLDMPCFANYLIQSEDEVELLYVHMLFHGREFEDVYKIIVFRFDFVNKVWEEAKSIGETAIFLGPLSLYFRLGNTEYISIAYFQDRVTLVLVKAYGRKAGLEKSTSQPTPTAVFSSTNGADTPFADITHFRSLIGALQYLAITRPDIQFAVNRVAQCMHQPSEHDYHCLKRILRYIFGTLGRSLLIRPGDLELRGFSDSDWVNDKNDRKSASG